MKKIEESMDSWRDAYSHKIIYNPDPRLLISDYRPDAYSEYLIDESVIKNGVHQWNYVGENVLRGCGIRL